MSKPPDATTLPAKGSRPGGPRLLVIAANTVRRIPIHGPTELTIGRGSDVEITIDDPLLSRRHARLYLGEVLEVEDLESSNGTVVRGSVVPPGQRLRVRAGEMIEVGDAVVVLEAAFVPPASKAPPTGGDTGDGRALEQVHLIADKVASSLISVLILGETGVGKGVLARRIHEHSPRAGKPFLQLNCAALPEQLLESELLGHERGAFTGAVESKPGLLETANGGTVFLDEIGELPATVQVKLLRVIEERRVLRVGGRSPRFTDIRFVSATNRDLERAIAQGAFRQDLYYRLAGVTLVIPPLRERTDEVLPLTRLFAQEAAQQSGYAQPPEVSPQVQRWLLEQPWPGNIRELRNLVQRAVVMSEGRPIEPEHLLVAAPAPRPSEAVSAEHQQILDALERFGGNQTHAAKFLGMSRTTLSARLDAYGIRRPRKR